MTDYLVAEEGGLRVRLVHDEDAESPRDWSNACSVVMVPNRRGYYPPDKNGGRLAHVWRHLCRDGDRWPMRDAVEQFERTVSILGGRSLYVTPHDGPSLIWYVFPDAIYVDSHSGERVWPEGATPDELDAALKGEAETYQQWQEGDVWGYVIEERVTWKRTDGQPGTMTVWQEIDEDGSVWGHFGYSYAANEAKLALAHEVKRRAAANATT